VALQAADAMNVYFISQDKNNGYDTYDSAVVIAPDEVTAKRIYPSRWRDEIIYLDEATTNDHTNWDWVDSAEFVQARLIGTATEGAEVEIVCASFNAG
jgi:hypothetical protein